MHPQLAYIPLFRRALESAASKPRNATHHYRRDFLGWLFSTMVGPMPRLGKTSLGKVKTTPDFVPRGMVNHRLSIRRKDQIQLLRCAQNPAASPGAASRSG